MAPIDLLCCYDKNNLLLTGRFDLKTAGVTLFGNIEIHDDNSPWAAGTTIDAAIAWLKSQSLEDRQKHTHTCKLYNSVAKKTGSGAWEGKGSSQLVAIEDLCEESPPVELNAKEKCQKKLGGEEVYDEKKKECKKNKRVWKDEECGCFDKDEKKKKKKKPKDIFGCGDKTASNYYCDLPENKCKDGKLPEGFVSTGCIWKRDGIVLVNKYCFCTTSLCQEGGNCIRPGTYTLTGTSEQFYDRVFTRAYNHINSIAPKSRFSNETGFYAARVDDTLKVDLATVLTILHLRHYSLVRKNNTYLVVYAPNGTELGFFKDVRREDKVFTTIDYSRTGNVYRKRLDNCPGCSVPEEYIKWFVERFKDKVNQDGTIVTESRTTLGLGSLITDESIGLEKLLFNGK